MSPGLRAEQSGDGRWRLAGGPGLELVNDYLGYLADRGYSPHTVRGYALDLLGFARWLAAERLGLAEVSTDVVLRYLAYCRRVPLPGRPGGNVYSIRDGRSTGYAPASINRRLAAVSGLFGYWAMRDPAAPHPVSAAGCWPTWANRSGERGCGSVSRGGCPAAWTGLRPPACWPASAP